MQIIICLLFLNFFFSFNLANAKNKIKFKNLNEINCTNYHLNKVQKTGDAIYYKTPYGILLKKMLQKKSKTNLLKYFILLGYKFRKQYFEKILPFLAKKQSPPAENVNKLKEMFNKLSLIALLQCRGKIDLKVKKWKKPPDLLKISF